VTEIYSLTKRKVEILQCAADGLSRKETGQKLDIAEFTVRAHRNKIIASMGTNNITHSVAIAIREGMIK